MRSRFAAFALDKRDYLLASWHPSTRPATLAPDRETRWIRLEILAAAGGMVDQEGEVEFNAHYRDAGGRGTLHERSRFTRHHGRWVYLRPL